MQAFELAANLLDVRASGGRTTADQSRMTLGVALCAIGQDSRERVVELPQRLLVAVVVARLAPFRVTFDELAI